VQGTKGSELHEQLAEAIEQHPQNGLLQRAKAVYVIEKASLWLCSMVTTG
jgi:hypothetical protein